MTLQYMNPNRAMDSSKKFQKVSRSKESPRTRRWFCPVRFPPPLRRCYRRRPWEKDLLVLADIANLNMAQSKVREFCFKHWWFSIVMLNYQRVIEMDEFHTAQDRNTHTQSGMIQCQQNGKPIVNQASCINYILITYACHGWNISNPLKHLEPVQTIVDFPFLIVKHMHTILDG